MNAVNGTALPGWADAASAAESSPNSLFAACTREGEWILVLTFFTVLDTGDVGGCDGVVGCAGVIGCDGVTVVSSKAAPHVGNGLRLKLEFISADCFLARFNAAI